MNQIICFYSTLATLLEGHKWQSLELAFEPSFKSSVIAQAEALGKNLSAKFNREILAQLILHAKEVDDGDYTVIDNFMASAFCDLSGVTGGLELIQRLQDVLTESELLLIHLHQITKERYGGASIRLRTNDLKHFEGLLEQHYHHTHIVIGPNKLVRGDF